MARAVREAGEASPPTHHRGGADVIARYEKSLTAMTPAVLSNGGRYYKPDVVDPGYHASLLETNRGGSGHWVGAGGAHMHAESAVKPVQRNPAGLRYDDDWGGDRKSVCRERV